MKYYKFLSHNLSSYHDPDFYYNPPMFKDKKWIPGKWMEESDCETSNEACGKGLHLMKVLSPIYTQYRGNCYEAEGDQLLGEDENKARFKRIRLLKPVNKDEIFKPSADLSSANLSSADLGLANLSSADLGLANLRSADLRSADLSSADLSSANLSSADLRSADLSSADLSSADLSSADLRSADLGLANLSSADLSSANLRNVRNLEYAINLDNAYWDKFTQIDKEFKKLLNNKRFING